MIEEFHDLPWHDAELKEIIIDRVSDQDIVKLSVVWPEDIDSERYDHIEFFKCYGLKADMHFGHWGADSILSANCVIDCPDLEQLKATWDAMGGGIGKIYCFTIETNSTASIIKIFAKGFRIIHDATIIKSNT